MYCIVLFFIITLQCEIRNFTRGLRPRRDFLSHLPYPSHPSKLNRQPQTICSARQTEMKTSNASTTFNASAEMRRRAHLLALLLLPILPAFGAGSPDYASPADSIPISGYDLDELEVVAEKPLIQADGSKLSFNFDADPSVKGLTLNDALRKVPMVSVDGEGNIRINGQSSFKIYVNGREDPSLTANYKNIFKAIPASSVLKVEVITEPGAKYDAEGTAGILNLVTVSRNSTDGYSGSIAGTFSKQQSGTSLYGRMRSGRLALSGNLNYYNSSIFSEVNRNTGSNHTEYLGTDNPFSTINIIRQNVAWDYLGGGINMSYDLSDRDLLTANVNATYTYARLKRGGGATFMVMDSSDEITGICERDLFGGIKNLNLTAGAAWEHDFGPEGRKMILSYLFSHGFEYLDADLTESESEGYTGVTPYEAFSNHGDINEHTVQLDYVHPLKKENNTIEAGVKGIFRRNPAKAHTLRGISPGEIIEDLSFHSDITQRQDIYAVYASYTGQFGAFSPMAGVRYEHTDMGLTYHYGNYTDFTNRLNDVVPNAALTWIFSQSSNLRLAYQMRISRPTLKQVNPSFDTYIPGIVDTGNPDLSSERSNKVGLTYTNFGRIIGGNIGVEYATISNAISQYAYSEGSTIINTFANIGKDNSFSLFGFANWNIIKDMQFSLNLRATRHSLSATVPHTILDEEGMETINRKLSNAGWVWDWGANWNYSFPCKLKVYAYGGSRTHDYFLQGTRNGWYYYGIGIGRDFLRDDQLNVTLSASNFFQKRMAFKTYTETENMRNLFTFYNQNWNVGVTLTWNFGNLKTDVKKTSRNIMNDDKSTVTGNSMM